MLTGNSLYLRDKYFMSASAWDRVCLKPDVRECFRVTKVEFGPLLHSRQPTQPLDNKIAPLTVEVVHA